MKSFIFIFLFLLTSCGDSPLLNHEMEKSLGLSDQDALYADALSFKKTSFDISVDWIVGPQLGESKFILRSWNKNEGTKNGPFQDLPHQFHALIWMPTMNHGSAPVKIKRIAQGEYEVSSVYFIMGGKWELKLQLLKDGKVFDETVLTYNL